MLNPDNGNTWQRITNAASTGTASIKMNNFSGNVIGEIDEYITSSFDLSGISAPTLTFKLAFARRTSLDTSALKIYVSTNCGQTWNLRYSKSGANLSTTGFTSSQFIPDIGEWRLETVNLYPYQNTPNVRFKFQFAFRGGNNLYVDDINVKDIFTGIDDPSFTDASFTVFPNPSSGKFDLTFETGKKEKVTLNLTDAMGRFISVISLPELQPGEHKYSFDKHLDAGVYFLQIKENERGWIQKIIVQ